MVKQNINYVKDAEDIDYSCERIVLAAIRLKDTYLVGVRHWDNLMVHQADMLNIDVNEYRKASEYEEGFITNRYNFINRDIGIKLAKHNGQYLNMLPPLEKERHINLPELYSEDLW